MAKKTSDNLTINDVVKTDSRNLRMVVTEISKNRKYAKIENKENGLTDVVDVSVLTIVGHVKETDPLLPVTLAVPTVSKP